MKRKRKIYLIITVVILSSCSNFLLNQSTNPIVVAYNNNSVKALELFLDQWEKELPSNSDSVIISDTVKIVYDLAEYLYNPHNRDYHLTPSEYDFSISNDLEPTLFVSLSDNIRFTIYDTLTTIHEVTINKKLRKYPKFRTGNIVYKNEINNFRPKFSSRNRIVYLSDKYDSLFYDFLPAYYHRPRNDKDRLLNLELKKKRNFLLNRMALNNCCGYRSKPYIVSVAINSNITEALIGIENSHSSFASFYKKVNNTWVYQYTPMSSIE